jgi:hypothetical protein
MEKEMKPAIILLFVSTISSITSLAFAQNRALSLDGNISYMEVPSSPSLDISTKLTIELWFTNDIPEDKFLLMKNSGVSYPYGLYITDNSSSAGFYLSLKESNVKQISRNGIFADGKWHHLAGTFDGQIMTLYINGVKRASLPLEKNDEIVTKSCPLQIGMSHSGLIDEVRLWQIACTQEQIQAMMNTTLTGKEEGLVGYWNFDDGAAKDLSPNGNDATLYNNARILEYPRAGQDNALPAVIKTIPGSSENVPTDIKEIKFFFSKTMNKGWAIEYLDNLPLGAIVWDDDMKILTLNIEQPLQPSTIYFVILNPTIAPIYINLTNEPNFFSDTEGNLLGEFFFTFTTEKRGEVDITPPQITEVVFLKTGEDGMQEKVLSDLSKEVPTDVTDIKIVFSEKMRERGNLSLKYSDNFPKCSPKWNKGGENSMTIVTIHLNEPLMPKSKYYIKLNVVDKKYVDLAENLLKPYTINFVTVGGSMFVPKKGCIATTWGAVRKK